SAGDLVLAHVAGELGAAVVPSPAGPEGLGAFLDDLVERWIALPIDGRFLALAVDCTRPEEAAPFGLATFVGGLDRAAPAAPERPAPRRLRVYAQGGEAPEHGGAGR